MEQQAQKAYGKENIHFYKSDFERPLKKEAVKDRAMEKEDFLRLREAMSNSKSFSKEAIELSFRCGLRINEVAFLKREDIDIENKTIYVSKEGAKNGRARVVPIREKDIAYFKDLLDRYPQNGYLTKVKAQSLDKCIRRYMKEVKDQRGEDLSHKYEKETLHTIRKLYATERMRELRGNEPLEDRKQEMKCWGEISKELGHSENREGLYNTYCKG